MSAPVWRIASETASHMANDMSGEGARVTGGRWNSVGVPLLYCSSSVPLAMLETLCYLQYGSMPLNRFLIRIDIPDEVWMDRQVLSPLPGGWDAVPAGLTSRLAGDAWVAQGRAALLVVPSVLIPEEENVLINPAHADTARTAATTVKRWHFDPRLLRAANSAASPRR
ncbi:MAG: RES family NAD+ phosphorylase [Massilia sp.]